jgi:murein DD-endopeptidase MepM/ murein hydrolase activator NlpD
VLLPLVALAAGLALGPQRPDSVVIPRGDLLRLYTDCSEARWPYGTEERFVPKTTEEMDSGVVRRRALESAWRAYFSARSGDSIRPTPRDAWRYPLAERGRLLDNFRNPREDGLHGALDLFVAREGVAIRSPVSGVVVAAGDGWRGGYERRGRGFFYDGEGLSRRAGNAAIVFDPASGGYFLFSHLQEGIRVRVGDVIAAGAPVGRVGRTGNAALPGHGKHLHLAYKEPGTACGIEGVLVAVDPYRWIRAARERDLPLRRPPAGPRPGTRTGRTPSARPVP